MVFSQSGRPPNALLSQKTWKGFSLLQLKAKTCSIWMVARAGCFGKTATTRLREDMPPSIQMFGALSHSKFLPAGASLAMLALLPCFAMAASKAKVEKPASFLTIARESDDIEKRSYDVFSAEFDLSSPKLEIEAHVSGESVQEIGRTERTVDLGNCLLAIGSDSFSDHSGDPQNPMGGTPAGPLVCDGSWTVTPRDNGLWSAVGFSADNHPVFSTNWLSESEPEIVSLEVEASPGNALPIACLNRVPDLDGISALTLPFFPNPRQKFAQPNAVGALLTERRSSPGRAMKEIGGPGGGFPYLVPKSFRSGDTYVVGDGMVALIAAGESASWLGENLRKNKAAQINIQPGRKWRRVRNAVGLGAPLVWKGRRVEPEDLKGRAELEWRGLDQPSRPVMAYFPDEHTLTIFWCQTAKTPKTSISRGELARQMIEKGACYVLELGHETRKAPIFLGEQWIAAEPTVSQSPSTPSVLAFRDRSKAKDKPLLNLCRLARSSARASSSSGAGNSASAVIDSRYGETPAMDSFWASKPNKGGDPQSWIQVELDRPRKVWAVEVCHAEAAGFSRHFNTADFKILGRKSRSDSWDELHVAEGNQEAWTFVELKKPKQLGTIRLEISKPNAFESNPNARIAEILVWGE